jgi:hypothetical protein
MSAHPARSARNKVAAIIFIAPSLSLKSALCAPLGQAAARRNGRRRYFRDIGIQRNRFSSPVRDAFAHDLLSADFIPGGDGKPSVSRRWVTDLFPKSGRLRFISYDASRTKPTVSRPVAARTFWILAENPTLLIGVSSCSRELGRASPICARNQVAGEAKLNTEICGITSSLPDYVVYLKCT